MSGCAPERAPYRGARLLSLYAGRKDTMPEFDFQDNRIIFQKVRYTLTAESESEARRLIAARQVAPVPDGPPVVVHAGELEPYRPALVATVARAGCPVWRQA